MKKSAILVLTAVGLLTAAGAAAWDMPLVRYCQRYDFNKRTSLRGSKTLALAENGKSGKALKFDLRTGNIYGYGSMALPLGQTGTLAVCFDCRAVNSGRVNLKLRINQNRPGKGNGSAGSATEIIEIDHTDWQRVRKSFEIRANANALQFVFSAANGNNEILIDNLELVYTPDTVKTVVQEKFDINTPKESPLWGKTSSSAGAFSGLKMAPIMSFMQIAADKEGVYFLFNNYLDPNKITRKTTQHDGDIWDDDANELFFFDEPNQTGKVFMLNSIGAAYDGELYQRMPGDPWRVRSSWNGSWGKAAKVTRTGFETRFFIPWKLLNIDPGKGGEIAFNAGGDYPAFSTYSTWNAYRGTRMDVAKYGKLKVENGQVTLSRARHSEVLNYAIERKNAKYKELLKTGTPGNYKIEIWNFELWRHNYPKALMAKTSDKTFFAWQEELFRAYLELGISGPRWPHTFYTGRQRMIDYYNKGMRFGLALSNSSRTMAAKRAGATLVNDNSRHGVDSNDPVFVKILTDSLYGYKKHPDYDFIKKSLTFVMGIDEPTNSVEICYDPNQNKRNVETLKKIDAVIRKEYGFNKYGIPFFSDVKLQDLPFARIAFYRYWNDSLLKNFTHLQNVVKEVFPGVPMNIFDDNNCSGQSTIDAANFNKTAELIAVDAYPTSTNASFGMARALYHTAFSTRVMGDLVPSAKLMLIPQGFIYHGGYGNEAAMREWVSQGLKNGAEWFMWYCGGAPHQIFKEFSEMLEISAELKQMDKLILPEKTNTLLWYSNFDKWAKADRAMHATYSTYVMLSEVLGCNFRIISDTTVRRNDVNLSDYKLLYVPQMSYTTPEISEKIAAWVKNGGTLVTFDPKFMSYNIDGSLNKFRSVLTGMQQTDLKVKIGDCSSLLYGRKSLATARISNAPSLPGNSYAAYIADKVDGKVIASYKDNTPAAWMRKVGKGKVIAFAMQPFAGSDVITHPGEWRNFFAKLAEEHNEAIDLPIRDFLMEKPVKRIKLKKILPD